jgi:hypothetical protein
MKSQNSTNKQRSAPTVDVASLLSALATTQGTKSVLGTSTEVQCLVNIELAELSDGVKALMTDMGNDRYKGDKDNDLAEPIAVNFLSMEPNVSEDGTERFWCKVG